MESRFKFLRRRFKFEYSTWANMLARCNCKTATYFSYYGGRGITVCEEWSEFSKFLNDMGERPEPKIRYSIDRKDSNKGYFKENCRWATRKRQGNNRRDNHIENYCGVSKTITEWANTIRLSEPGLRKRLKKNWPLSKAILPVPKLSILKSA